MSVNEPPSLYTEVRLGLDQRDLQPVMEMLLRDWSVDHVPMRLTASRSSPVSPRGRRGLVSASFGFRQHRVACTEIP